MARILSPIPFPNPNLMSPTPPTRIFKGIVGRNRVVSCSMSGFINSQNLLNVSLYSQKFNLKKMKFWNFLFVPSQF